MWRRCFAASKRQKGYEIVYSHVFHGGADEKWPMLPTRQEWTSYKDSLVAHLKTAKQVAAEMKELAGYSPAMDDDGSSAPKPPEEPPPLTGRYIQLEDDDE
ncbi:hypothetical protein LCGC14_2431890 [marine sediment metagenome]|uniref:Uncharacterized protein n=1 Tax=marine sediment metagenome TaxID=412755 RepID=A0A0F9C931_9ZZZZ